MAFLSLNGCKVLSNFHETRHCGYCSGPTPWLNEMEMKKKNFLSLAIVSGRLCGTSGSHSVFYLPVFYWCMLHKNDGKSLPLSGRASTEQLRHYWTKCSDPSWPWQEFIVPFLPPLSPQRWGLHLEKALFPFRTTLTTPPPPPKKSLLSS